MAGSCLTHICVAIGIFFGLASVAGIGFSLFLIFGEPLPDYQVQGTYTPSWEDIGPALVISVVSLLVNVLLVGGARQMSKDFILVWIVWKSLAVILFWAWYGYSQLKHYGYIDWTAYGMKGCYFCDLIPEAMYVVFGGVGFTVAILLSMIPVEMLRSHFKKRHRELTETMGYPYSSSNGGSTQHMLQSHPQGYQFGQPAHTMSAYEMYDQEQQRLQMLQQQQLLQQYQQYPPPQLSSQDQFHHHNPYLQQQQQYPQSVQYR